jgi:hypothetical protein
VKIKHIAAAALLPATIASLALSSGAADAATTGHAQGHATQHKAKRDPRWVTVRTGETLSGIAAAHDVSWKALLATPPNLRTLRHPDWLRAGERLRIPENPRFRAHEFQVKYAARLRPEFAAYEHDRARPPRHRAGLDAAAPQGSQYAQAQEGTTQTGQYAQPGNYAQAGQYAQPGQYTQYAQAAPSGGGSLTSGMSSFESCVAFRESTDTPTDPDGLFGILPSTWASLGYSGSAGQASVAQQKVAFNRLYAEDGTQPWAPSDGC